MKWIKCDRGDYRAPISSDYGIPEQLVPECILWHEIAHKGHTVKIIEEGNIK